MNEYSNCSSVQYLRLIQDVFSKKQFFANQILHIHNLRLYHICLPESNVVIIQFDNLATSLRKSTPGCIHPTKAKSNVYLFVNNSMGIEYM